MNAQSVPLNGIRGSSFWTTLFAEPQVPPALKVAAVEEGRIEGLSGEQGARVLVSLLVGSAWHWKAQDQERLRRLGLLSDDHADPLEWKSSGSLHIRNERDEALKGVVQALVAAGAPVWHTPSCVPDTFGALDLSLLELDGLPSALELAYRLGLPGCFALMLRSDSAPPPSVLEKLACRPSETTWLEQAADHPCPDFLPALLSHGLKPTFSAAKQVRSLSGWSHLVNAGLKLDDPAQRSSLFWSWAHDGRPSIPVGEPLPEGWLSASAWALRASVSHWGSLDLKTTKKQARALAQRHGVEAWSQNRWERASGRWKGQWSLPAAYALLSLRHEPQTAGAAGLAAWLAHAPPRWAELSSVPGIPDRGWWSLACWLKLSQSSNQTLGVENRERFQAWALEGLGVRRWSDPQLAPEALAVTQWVAGKLQTRRGALSQAWEQWVLGLSEGLAEGFHWFNLAWVDTVEALADPGLGLSMPSLLKHLQEAQGHPLPSPELTRLVCSAVALSGAPGHPGRPASEVNGWMNLCWPHGQPFPLLSPLPVVERVVDILERCDHPRAPLARATYSQAKMARDLGQSPSGEDGIPVGPARPRF